MSNYNFRLLPVAREARSFTQEQLVERIPNLTQGNYSKMEKGLLQPTPDTLSNIANALNFPIEFFFHNRSFYNQTEYYYRKRSTMPRKHQIKLEATFDISRIWIEELLSSVEIPEFRLPPIKVREDNSPEDIARKVRTFLNVPRGPIDKLVSLMEKSGIIVFFLNDAPEKFDGTTIVTSSGQNIIVINSCFPNDRKRFTIAHEFFHIIAHMPHGPLADDDRDPEDEANRFASEFLMPELDIRRELINFKFSMLGDLKLRWMMSKAAILKRAHTLKFIDSNKYKNFMIELSRSGERKTENLRVPLDEPRILKMIVDTYTSHLGYTLEDLCKSIAISESDLNHLILGKPINHMRIVL
ncbi:Zn-dependent peptidase ImmA, M78 family [Dyadobacter soli]|uniref:Zn-dependent peptidase ImmA, M78 family n=1 Tax=Dyadobacter soli TaxID=659014 RepID=A0A1G7G282_9BACT|nr:XRE family transcriptional regulator [Dyadobacter soli]SDE82155.1 Zn-dependent peptidase ImmA, M78 family [Dyadobacter soli]